MQVNPPLSDGNDRAVLTVGDNRRICPSGKTFERVIRFAPVMGITRIANITGLDTIGVPVYTAHRPNSRSLAATQGKGSTREDARASALMEAVEAYHAETIGLPLRLGSYIEMSCSGDVIDVAKLPKPEGHVFTPHARILWIEGDDLISGRKKFVPYEMVHLDFCAPLPGHGCFSISSNGLASGNHIAEALIHGICEVVEMDALLKWRRKPVDRQQADKIDLGQVADPRCRSILERFYQAGVHVGVWEITNGTGIPCFLCRILPEMASDISGIRPASGMGCHLSRDIALLRALTEAAQSRLTFISGVRDDLTRDDYQRFLTAEEHAKWRDSILDEPSALKDFRQIASYETRSLDRDMKVLLERMKEAGTEEIVAIDLTKPEFGIPVARVIIPGMEGDFST